MTYGKDFTAGSKTINLSNIMAAKLPSDLAASLLDNIMGADLINGVDPKDMEAIFGILELEDAEVAAMVAAGFIKMIPKAEDMKVIPLGLKVFLPGRCATYTLGRMVQKNDSSKYRWALVSHITGKTYKDDTSVAYSKDVMTISKADFIKLLGKFAPDADAILANSAAPVKK